MTSLESQNSLNTTHHTCKRDKELTVSHYVIIDKANTQHPPQNTEQASPHKGMVKEILGIQNCPKIQYDGRRMSPKEKIKTNAVHWRETFLTFSLLYFLLTGSHSPLDFLFMLLLWKFCTINHYNALHDMKKFSFQKIPEENTSKACS